MRALLVPPSETVAEILAVQLREPVSPPPSPTSSCDPHTCTWWPYSKSREFEANIAMILILLFCALICALVLKTAIRCSRRSSRDSISQRKPTPVTIAIPEVEPSTVVFTVGMKLAGAEPECAICLSEFEEGEAIRVLGSCKHGFHVPCIQQWLSSHSSCPTCRGSIRCPSPSFSVSPIQTGLERV